MIEKPARTTPGRHAKYAIPSRPLLVAPGDSTDEYNKKDVQIRDHGVVLDAAGGCHSGRVPNDSDRDRRARKT